MDRKAPLMSAARDSSRGGGRIGRARRAMGSVGPEDGAAVKPRAGSGFLARPPLSAGAGA
ncbi:hypothetical protein D9598_13540 [Roseomonas sp. KE0001]|nr:hypothetical protein [Roseomonas sp. KE0001]